MGQYILLSVIVLINIICAFTKKKEAFVFLFYIWSLSMIVGVAFHRMYKTNQYEKNHYPKYEKIETTIYKEINP